MYMTHIYTYIFTYSKIPHLTEAEVVLKTINTSVTGWDVEQSFPVWKLFYDVIYSKSSRVTSKKTQGEVNLPQVCSNTSTFATDDLAECLCCVLLAIWCAFGAHLDVGV